MQDWAPSFFIWLWGQMDTNQLHEFSTLWPGSTPRPFPTSSLGQESHMGQEMLSGWGALGSGEAPCLTHAQNPPP